MNILQIEYAHYKCKFIIIVILLWINRLKSMSIIGDKIFNKEIQVRMLPHVIVFQICQAYYCLFVYGDTHRNRS